MQLSNESCYLNINMKIQIKKIKPILYYTGITLLLTISLLSVISSTQPNLPIKLFSVESGSMTPTINKGDIIAVSTNNNTYNVDDIITFRTGNHQGALNNTHRIIEITQANTYITQGDNNQAKDIDPVSQEQIIGKYIFRIPLLGYPILFIQTIPGFIFLIIIPTTILIYEEIKKIKYEISKRKQE